MYIINCMIYCAVRNESLYVIEVNIGRSPRRLGSNSRPAEVTFVVDEVALGQVSFQVLRISPVIIIPPVRSTQLHLNVTLIRRTDEVWDSSKTSALF